MRKIFTLIAVGALAVSLAAAPSVIAKKGHKKGSKNVAGTVTVVAAPSTIEPATATVAVSGNVKSSSSCRKNRTVHFSYTDSVGATALTETAVTKSNGKYSVTLPKPTTTGPASVTLTATVDQATRVTKGQAKGKGKKKGHAKGKARKFNCLATTGTSVLTVN
jgi:hypothetical protein